MNSLQNVSTNIPLHCNVCPKKPDFSDVSHLLTHISSKGHLSNYYKMKLKASQDNAARKIIEDYDEWYEDWNLQDMMQERMSQKEKKRGSGSGSASRRTSASASARSTPVPSNNSLHRQSRLRDSIQDVDPALNNHNRHRQWNHSRSVTPNSGYGHDSFFYTRSNPYAPPLHNWAPDASLFNSPIKQESFDSDYSDDDTFDPNPRRAPARRATHRQRDSLPSLDDFEPEQAANDNSRLKGVVWPGMSIFDSATAEMQRKRNQKKHGSVLIQLQATSEDTEPVEFVFRDGNLEKQRTITGNPESSDSLIEGESSPEPEVPEKKRPRRRAPRPALAEKDTNSGRVLRTRGDSHHPPFSRKRGPYYDVIKSEEDDDDMTYSNPRPRKRSGLSIHRDNSGPDITFNNPAPMNFLTTGFNTSRQSSLRRSALAPLDHNANPPHPDSFSQRNHFRQGSDTWGQLNSGFRPSAHMPNPTNNMMNFAAFGQFMTNHGLAPPNNIGQQSHLGSTQYQPQQYSTYGQAQAPQMQQNENIMFSQPQQQNVAAWDNGMFGFSNADMSAFLPVADLNFETSNIAENAAPLVFKEDFSKDDFSKDAFNKEVDFKEDDEVTLSAENSEH